MVIGLNFKLETCNLICSCHIICVRGLQRRANRLDQSWPRTMVSLTTDVSPTTWLQSAGHCQSGNCGSTLSLTIPLCFLETDSAEASWLVWPHTWSVHYVNNWRVWGIKLNYLPARASSMTALLCTVRVVLKTTNKVKENVTLCVCPI